MIRTLVPRLSFLIAFALLSPIVAPAQQASTEYRGAAELGLELRRLGTIKRVLMIGAHPDDESTQILSTLALGQGADVAYLSLTRGEGGQNGIGPELQEGLGLLRTEELLAARRLDGARQYFTRAYDFGFSKDADESFRHWPRDSILEDVVAVIRDFRPDVVLSVFTGTPRDGHGQHQVAGIVAREAFEIAGDSMRYPEQIARGLRPFSPTRLYQGLWGGAGSDATLLETGVLDPLLGQSYYQVAMASRSRHRSQDMGRELTPGPQRSSLQLVSDRSPEPAGEASVFAGTDTTLTGLAARTIGSPTGTNGAQDVLALLRAYEVRVEAIRGDFDPLQPSRLVPGLSEAVRLIGAARQALPAGRLRDAVTTEERDARAALWMAAGLSLDAVSEDETIVPGQSFAVSVSLWNGGEREVTLRRLDLQLPAGWKSTAAEPLPGTLPAGALLTREFTVTAPASARLTRPYFLRAPRNGDLYTWPADHASDGLPFEPPAVLAVADVDVGTQTVDAREAVTYRGVDIRQGEFRRPVRVVPAVSATLSPGTAILPLMASSAASPVLRFDVRLRSEAPDGVTGTLIPRAAEGWTVEPSARALSFARPGEEQVVEFALHPPATAAPGEAAFAIEFRTDDGASYREGFALVDYPHIHPRPLYRTAEATIRAFPIDIPHGLTVGYIPGAGDDAPQALRQVGVDVTELSPADLASGDLSRFDAILTGIRAYEVNADLIAHNDRVLDYARAGGTVVVQYNKYEYTEPGIAPYPVTMARPHDRVTDEEAAVVVLDPTHPAFNSPNRITAADFEGWVQERGLYFLHEWDDHFTPLLEMADPGEAPGRGSLLVAPLGQGRYVYTGLAFFRQLPEGVPGAYRLLVNLLSLGRTP